MTKVKIVEKTTTIRNLLYNIVSDNVQILDVINLPCKPQKGDYITHGLSQSIVQDVILIAEEDYIVVII